MAQKRISVGNVEILSLSDGMIEFDLCNFFSNGPARTLASVHVACDGGASSPAGHFPAPAFGKIVRLAGRRYR